MDRIARQAYEQMCGTYGYIPLGVQRLHGKVERGLKRYGQPTLRFPKEIQALVVALAEEPEVGEKVLVQGQGEGTFQGYHGCNTIRVSFSGDDKQYRVIPVEAVTYAG